MKLLLCIYTMIIMNTMTQQLLANIYIGQLLLCPNRLGLGVPPTVVTIAIIIIIIIVIIYITVVTIIYIYIYLYIVCISLSLYIYIYICALHMLKGSRQLRWPLERMRRGPRVRPVSKLYCYYYYY